MLLSAAVSAELRLASSDFAAAAASAAFDAAAVAAVLAAAVAPVAAVACEAERPWGSPQQQRPLLKGFAASLGSGAPSRGAPVASTAAATAACAEAAIQLLSALVRLRRGALLSEGPQKRERGASPYMLTEKPRFV